VRLGIFFADHLTLAIMPNYELAAFRANGVTFRASASDALTFLYDRLLDASGQLAGILLWCLPDGGFGADLTELASRSHPYLVRWSEFPKFALCGVLLQELTPAEAEDLWSDGSQGFGDQVFRSDDGGLAITLDLHLARDKHPAAAADLATIRAASASWMTVTDLIELGVAEA
jgi:hypothetical protein